MATLTGTSSNDTLTGGTGADTAVIASATPMTTFSLDANGHWVVTSTQGTDTLARIESARFLDSTIGLGIGPQTLDAASAYGQNQPTVATLNNGDYVVSWHGGVPGNYVQRFDAAGESLVGPYLVSATDSEGPDMPTITALAGGGFVVAWEERYSGGVVAQRFDASGAPVGAQLTVDGANDSYRYYYAPTVTAFSDGGFAIGFDYNTGGYSIFPRIVTFDASGARTGEITPTTRGSTSYPNLEVAALSKGGYVVAYTGMDGFQTGLFAQRFNGDGTKNGTEINVAASAGYPTNNDPVVTGLADGGFAIAWAKSDSSVYVQRFDATGAAAANALKLNGDNYLDTGMSPVITSLGDGGYLVAWQSRNYDGSYAHAQRFDAKGALAGSEIVLPAVKVSAGQLDIAPQAGGGFVVSWTGADDHIHMMRYDAAGLPILYSLSGDA